jgi:hypothetical protein
MKRVLLSCVALLVVASCSEDSSPTAPIVSTGKLIVMVIESGTNAGIANATIELRKTEDGPVVISGKTNALGVFEIAVQPGAYWTSVVPPAGYSYSGPVPQARLLTFTPGQTAGMTVLLAKQ